MRLVCIIVVLFFFGTAQDGPKHFSLWNLSRDVHACELLKSIVNKEITRDPLLVNMFFRLIILKFDLKILFLDHAGLG